MTSLLWIKEAILELLHWTSLLLAIYAIEGNARCVFGLNIYNIARVFITDEVLEVMG